MSDGGFVNNNVNNNTNVINIQLAGVTSDSKQLPWIVRAIWYCCAGFYLTFFWLVIAYIFALLIVTLPWANRMFAMTPTILTLQRR